MASYGPEISALSCTQLQVLRKLALLKLTALMEKYCPPHRTGWNWDLPKFIKKIKNPSYRGDLCFNPDQALLTRALRDDCLNGSGTLRCASSVQRSKF